MVTWLSYPTVIFLVFLSFSPGLVAENCEKSPLRGKAKACAVSSLQEDISGDPVSKDIVLRDIISRNIESFHDASLQKVENVLEDKEFQDFISEITLKKAPSSLDSSVNLNLPIQTASGFNSLKSSSFYVFVSFSCSEKALMNLAKEAKFYGATLVLRGFKKGSYIKTAKSLQKIIQKTGQGVIIDPELFTLFAITTVPTLVLSKPVPLLSTDRVQTPIHDRLQGHVSLHYALELFAKEGDLDDEAKKILAQRGHP